MSQLFYDVSQKWHTITVAVFYWSQRTTLVNVEECYTGHAYQDAGITGFLLRGWQPQQYLFNV